MDGGVRHRLTLPRVALALVGVYLALALLVTSYVALLLAAVAAVAVLLAIVVGPPAVRWTRRHAVVVGLALVFGLVLVVVLVSTPLLGGIGLPRTGRPLFAEYHVYFQMPDNGGPVTVKRNLFLLSHSNVPEPLPDLSVHPLAGDGLGLGVVDIPGPNETYTTFEGRSVSLCDGGCPEVTVTLYAPAGHRLSAYLADPERGVITTKTSDDSEWTWTEDESSPALDAARARIGYHFLRPAFALLAPVLGPALGLKDSSAGPLALGAVAGLVGEALRAGAVDLIKARLEGIFKGKTKGAAEKEEPKPARAPRRRK